MTVERCLYVRLSGSSAREARDLQSRADAARERARFVPVGDREEIVRFEQVCTRLEALALARLAAGGADVIDLGDTAPDDDARLVIGERIAVSVPPTAQTKLARWRVEGSVAVRVRVALAAGPTPLPALSPPVPVADVWRPRDGQVGLAAVLDRFVQQLEAVCGDTDEGDKRPVLRPSGVSNRALTEGLRRFAAGAPGVTPVKAPVVYGDNSRAADFPLRGLGMTTRPLPAPSADEKCLTFALMSIRHMEMDADVQGAWLRNSDVSRSRPTADTDEFVYRESARQLRALCTTGRSVRVEMYQTGFEPAVVGFYRAVADHLAHMPGTLRVVPRYYSKHGVAPYGTPWWTSA